LPQRLKTAHNARNRFVSQEEFAMLNLIISVAIVALLAIFFLKSQSPTQQAEAPVQAMEKAKGLEQLTQQQAEDQFKQIDEQTQ
jgi:hypothetical protein